MATKCLSAVSGKNPRPRLLSVKLNQPKKSKREMLYQRIGEHHDYSDMHCSDYYDFLKIASYDSYFMYS